VTKKSKLTSAGGAQNRYSSGTVVSLPRVIGHRDLGTTECPGNQLYSQIATIRRQVQKRIKRFSKGRCVKICRACKRKVKGNRSAGACVRCRTCKRKATRRRAARAGASAKGRVG
jgi:hypothetical protein